jgi:DNA-binding transcriptional regulator WhiA
MMEFWPQGLRNMGTDPLSLLRLIKSSGFTIKIIEEKKRVLVGLEEVEAIGNYLNLNNDQAAVNLFLEK